MIPIRRLEEYRIDRKAAVDAETLAIARNIVDEVRRHGDGAVRRYAKEFDGVELDAIELTADEGGVPGQALNALRSAFESVLRFHRNAAVKGFEIQPWKGVTLGIEVVPYQRAGLYVPGGRAIYPSSLIMAATPAIVAGVKEIVLCCPSNEPILLATAKMCGVSRVFRIGGAQAIAAMAYGTETVPRCEILAGPGNRFVTAAKKLVAEDVAIDFLAGPTEILVVSDGETDPRFIAADMIAQAEHDPAASAILVTPSEKQARNVAEELLRQVPGLERADTVETSLKDRGALLVAPDLDAAVAFANAFAPEHLVLSCRHPRALLKSVRNAGSVFLGEHSPVAVGDYGIGPNAILPTMGDARFRSGLSPATFVKTISYQMLSPEGLAVAAPTALALAKVEGLGAHARSIEIRHGR